MQVPFEFDASDRIDRMCARVGAIFGYFSARRAAHLAPIQALRHE